MQAAGDESMGRPPAGLWLTPLLCYCCCCCLAEEGDYDQVEYHVADAVVCEGALWRDILQSTTEAAATAGESVGMWLGRSGSSTTTARYSANAAGAVSNGGRRRYCRYD